MSSTRAEQEQVIPERRHPAAVAWYAWIASDTGQGCRDAFTLHAPADQSTYLENRLHAAFMAGYEAARGETDARASTGEG